MSIGPVISESFGTTVGLSDEGPIAGAVFSRIMRFWGVTLEPAGGLGTFASKFCDCNLELDTDSVVRPSPSLEDLNVSDAIVAEDGENSGGISSSKVLGSNLLISTGVDKGGEDCNG